MPVRDRIDRRRRIARLAAAQSGYFTAAQAREAGYSYSAQRYHVHRGNWHQVDRALFRLPEWPVGPHEHLARWTLWSRGRAVVSNETALAVHGLGDVNPARVHLTVPRGFRQQAHGVILHRGEVPDADRWEQGGYRVTTPLRSVLDVAAGNLEVAQLATVIADALDRGAFTRRMLLERADEYGAHGALRIERALRQLGAR
ncbi:MAG: type IV toxin-antitoxin system AbiEi family antitoxin domain-containing protein [Thermoleophilia bacterium]|nr:type IV toxin-antitoxin system AbiEi family antitoxin domain-containing protein [Thermoleophilia bacterium]